jgi:hypothetical protein
MVTLQDFHMTIDTTDTLSQITISNFSLEFDIITSTSLPP